MTSSHSAPERRWKLWKDGRAINATGPDTAQWLAVIPEQDAEQLREALQPFAALADKADELRHGPGSTAAWRMAYDDLARARAALEGKGKLDG